MENCFLGRHFTVNQKRILTHLGKCILISNIFAMVFELFVQNKL
jgi:hypothetical protein